MPSLEETNPHTIELIVDQLIVPGGDADLQAEFRKRLSKSVETTLEAGNGLLIVAMEGGEDIPLSKHNACPYCDTIFFELVPSLFNFNSPDGMCSDCNGLGLKLSVDPDLIIHNPHLSLLDGVSPWWGTLRQKKRTGNWMMGEIFGLADHFGVDLELPWNKLSQEFRNAVLYGSGEENVRYTYAARREWGRPERPYPEWRRGPAYQTG